MYIKNLLITKNRIFMYHTINLEKKGIITALQPPSFNWNTQVDDKYFDNANTIWQRQATDMKP